MAQLSIPRGVDKSTRLALQKFAKKFRGDSTPTFATMQLTNLTASRLVASNSTDELVSVTDLTSWIAGTANEISVADDGDGTVTIGLVDPLIVGKGGTGATSLTDHSILLGSGTSTITALGAATNGQLPIGSTGADPVLAGLTGTANQITVTNGAGSITLSTPQDIHTACDLSVNTVDATTSYKVSGTKVIGSQQSHIADTSTQDLTGTDSIDQTKLESDLSGIVSTINSILSTLETHGLVANA